MPRKTITGIAIVNFNHGTGHGVGYLLNIHEGPASFRWVYRKGNQCVIDEGMVITDEPGIYIEGSHGVRLENELLCVLDELMNTASSSSLSQ